VMGRFSLGNVPFQTLTALRFLVALPFLLVLAIPGDGLGQTVAGLTQAPLMVALLALIPGLIGMLLYYHGLHGTRASVATLAELAFPFTAVVVGWLFLQRAPSLNQLIGFGLLWLALLALSRLEAPRPLTPTAAAAAQVAGAD
jgi:drug/metabolite transporter (DMT)-like permease